MFPVVSHNYNDLLITLLCVGTVGSRDMRAKEEKSRIVHHNQVPQGLLVKKT
jgi:hypothetical protein